VGERHHLEDLSICGKIIIKLIPKKWYADEWTGLHWLRIWTGWRALVNAVMNLGVP